ncbi:methylglyoxal synthase [Natronolimnohabitans innermongolicus JCM 12255]|uniref:Methylglyoxal synthase n=2 Tax=Natronolimnohabitans innermongolicus TaxID=253107 RepID=L9X7L5_9EURY|nr:methylglyoxal synthase [Natronolimnohabitans innermongolicus JCM 12255]
MLTVNSLANATDGMTRVALIAHDETKPDLIDFAREHESQLSEYELVATGTTGKRLQEDVGLEVDRKQSGPLGGDLQIGAEVADDRLDGIVFLRDPLRAQPHEPDISALLRICDVHDTALATNLASATFLIEGLAE